MTRILVIQLCRIGDILMTGPLLRGLRRAHPRAEISLMVMDTFASTPLPAHLYDRLIAFPLGGLARRLADDRGAWDASLVSLRGFLGDLGSAPFDLVVNLTHTDMSALVTSLVPARKRTGLVMRADRRKGLDSPWMTYLRASMRSRDVSAFHVVDLFCWTAGVSRDAGGLEIAVTEADRAWARGFLDAHGLTGRPFIAMQLGASTESKQWPVERFAALADALDPALGDIVLVGGPGERALADRFLAASARGAINGAGESTLGGLAALLAESRLLVTNDTGPMHVAAAVGTRVMDISSGPVSAYETGPYGAGHVVIEPVLACSPCPIDAECHHFACRFTLTPEDAAAVARYAMGEGPAPALTGARLMQARRTATTGRIEFLPVGSLWTVQDHVRRAAAIAWAETLQAPSRAGDGWPAPGPDDAEPGPVTAEAGAALTRIAGRLREVASAASDAAATVRALPKAPPARIPAIADGVHRVLESLLAAGESERALHALVTALRHEIDSVAATDLPGIARAQASAYAATARRAARMADLLAARVAEPQVA